ncbi:MAG: hypothetical protein RIR87_1697, partial [Actinomycetota bacterium]
AAFKLDHFVAPGDTTREPQQAN